MIRSVATVLGLAALIPAGLPAQAHVTPHPSMPKHAASFEELLFPPELVMQHQRELALTPQQRTTITEAVKALQAGVVDQQWQIQDEQQKLHELMARPTVEEAAVLAQVDRVLDLERSIKRLHLVMLVRIKNTLTPDQQERLKAVHHGGVKIEQELREP
jgi:Spy/CpxP family protein refolding chaperone